MSRRARQLRRRRSKAGPARAVFVVLGVLLATLIIGVAGGVGYIASVAGSAPDISELKPVDQGAISVVYAADGRRAWASSRATRCARRSRPRRCPQSIRNATVAIEDHRFYKHGGVDYVGIVRAAIKNVLERRDRRRAARR